MKRRTFLALVASALLPLDMARGLGARNPDGFPDRVSGKWTEDEILRLCVLLR